MDREYKEEWNAELQGLQEDFPYLRPPGAVPPRVVFLPDREWFKLKWYRQGCFVFMWFILIGPDLKRSSPFALPKFELVYWHLVKGDGFLVPGCIIVGLLALFWWLGLAVPQVVCVVLGVACWIASVKGDLRVRGLVSKTPVELDEKELQ